MVKWGGGLLVCSLPNVTCHFWRMEVRINDNFMGFKNFQCEGADTDLDLNIFGHSSSLLSDFSMTLIQMRKMFI